MLWNITENELQTKVTSVDYIIIVYIEVFETFFLQQL